MIKHHFFSILAMVGVFATAACSPPAHQQVTVSQVQQVQAPEPKLYTSPQECQADPTNVNPQLCAAAFAQSQAQLTHYNSYAACSAYGYNDCVDHGGWFGPMMTGFMLGAISSNGYYGSPVYVLHGGYYGGGYYGHSLNYGAPVRVGGHYVISHDVVVHHNYAVQHAAPATVVTRGGFGSSVTTASVNRPSVTPVNRPYVAAPSSAATVQRGGFGGFGGATTANSGYHAPPAYHASSSSGSSRRR